MENKKGLSLLSVIGICEGFSFYGTGIIITLFMTQFLKLTLGFSLLIYGTYCGLVYITSLFGGYLGDTKLGSRYLINIGNILMLAGLLFLTGSALSYNPQVPIHSIFLFNIQEIMLILSLICIIFGEGILRVSVSSIVPLLYEDSDKTIDKSFTTINMTINVGMVIASILLGLTIGEGNPYLYKYGFLFLALSSVVALIVYNLFKNKYLINKKGELVGLKPNIKNVSSKIKEKLTQKEKNHIKAIIIIQIFAIIFFIGFEQIDAVLMFFVKDYMVNTIMFIPFKITPELIRFIEPFGVIIFSLLFIKYSKNNEKLLFKMIVGISLILLVYIIFFIPCTMADLGIINIPLSFVVIIELLRSISEIMVLPIVLSIVSLLAPEKYLSRLMSLTYVALATAYIISGMLGGFFPSGSITPYLFGIIPIADFKSYCLIFIVMYCALLAIILASKGKIRKLME
ncbi:MAG: MFS transporter [archaeon]|nr:MFS transporter [archaeon]